MRRGDVDGHGLHTTGGVESRETDAHREDAFSVACGLVLLTRNHEGIIVLAQLQPLTLWVVSIPISRQRLIIPCAAALLPGPHRPATMAGWLVELTEYPYGAIL